MTTDTPKLTVTAQTGSTVQFLLNGTVIATGTETSAGSGIFTATIPAGKLAVGDNTVTATATGTGGTSAASTSLDVIYAPDYSSGVYVVPGAPGSSETLNLAWTAKQAGFKNELGYFIVDSIDGSINGIAPGSSGYAQAALSSSTRQVIFAQGKTAGATNTITLEGGQMVVFYLIQNSTTAKFLSENPSNKLSGGPLAFFSIQSANPDGKKHTQIVADPTTGHVEFNWEDQTKGSDFDFNDAVITVRMSDDTSTSTATLHAPGTGSTTVTLTGTEHPGKKSTPPGDVGVYFVDDPSGTVGGLTPSDSGYWAAALATGNFQVLFGSGWRHAKRHGACGEVSCILCHYQWHHG